MHFVTELYGYFTMHLTINLRSEMGSFFNIIAPN